MSTITDAMRAATGGITTGVTVVKSTVSPISPPTTSPSTIPSGQTQEQKDITAYKSGAVNPLWAEKDPYGNLKPSGLDTSTGVYSADVVKQSGYYWLPEQEAYTLFLQSEEKEIPYLDTLTKYGYTDRNAYPGIESKIYEQIISGKKRATEIKTLITEQERTIAEQELELKTFRETASTDPSYYWSIPDNPETKDIDESAIKYSRGDIISMMESNIASNKEILGKNIKSFTDYNEQIFEQRESLGTVQTYKSHGYVPVVNKDESLSFRSPTAKETYEYVYGAGVETKGRMVASEIGEWGIPAIIGIGYNALKGGYEDISNMIGGIGDWITGKKSSSNNKSSSPFYAIGGFQKGVGLEEERQYQKLLNLSKTTNESDIDYLGRVFNPVSNPDVIMDIYVPIATIGIGEVYTELTRGAEAGVNIVRGATRGGEEVVSTGGRIATYGAMHPGSVKVAENVMFGTGLVFAGLSGAEIGYTAAINPEMTPFVVGQVARGYGQAGAGFITGNILANRAMGIPLSPKDAGTIIATNKETGAMLRNLDMNMDTSETSHFIQPIGKNVSESYGQWIPETPRYGLEKVSVSGYGTSKDIGGGFELVENIGVVKAEFEPTRSIFGTTTSRTSFGVAETSKFAYIGDKEIIPYLVESNVRFGDTTIVASKGYGVIGKNPMGEGWVEIDLLGETGSKAIKGFVEKIPSNIFSQKGGDIYIAKNLKTGDITFGTVDEGSLIGVSTKAVGGEGGETIKVSEGFDVNTDIGTSDIIKGFKGFDESIIKGSSKGVTDIKGFDESSIKEFQGMSKDVTGASYGGEQDLKLSTKVDNAPKLDESLEEALMTAGLMKSALASSVAETPMTSFDTGMLFISIPATGFIEKEIIKTDVENITDFNESVLFEDSYLQNNIQRNMQNTLFDEFQSEITQPEEAMIFKQTQAQVLRQDQILQYEMMDFTEMPPITPITGTPFPPFMFPKGMNLQGDDIGSFDDMLIFGRTKKYQTGSLDKAFKDFGKVFG